MIRVRRNFYNFTDLSGTGAIAALLGTTLIAGDVLLYGTTQVVYGVVNAAANAVVLATN